MESVSISVTWRWPTVETRCYIRNKFIYHDNETAFFSEKTILIYGVAQKYKNNLSKINVRYFFLVLLFVFVSIYMWNVKTLYEQKWKKFNNRIDFIKNQLYCYLSE